MFPQCPIIVGRIFLMAIAISHLKYLEAIPSRNTKVVNASFPTVVMNFYKIQKRNQGSKHNGKTEQNTKCLNSLTFTSVLVGILISPFITTLIRNRFNYPFS